MKLTDREKWFRKHQLNNGGYHPTADLRLNGVVIEQKWTADYLDFDDKWVPIRPKFKDEV